MIYEKWMQYCDDNVRIIDLIIPSAHGCESYSFKESKRCQDGDFYDQFRYGARYFKLMLDTDEKGNIVLCKGLTKGEKLEEVLKDFAKIIMTSEEFFIIEIGVHPVQKSVGNLGYQFFADRTKVNELIAKYLEPSLYAYDNRKELQRATLGDMKELGKRYILVNRDGEYNYSVDTDIFTPWRNILSEKKGLTVSDPVGFFVEYDLSGKFWITSQHTIKAEFTKPITIPRRADIYYGKRYLALVSALGTHREYLEKANVISADFLTENYTKSRGILILNVLKDNVKSDKISDFIKGLW